MIDTQVRQIIEKPLVLCARAFIAVGIKADTVTMLGFIIGCLAGIAIWQGSFTIALCLILLSRFCDGLDGTIARQLGATDRGAFLDISLDFLFYSWIPLSFALHDAQNALAATFLIFSFVGTGTSFLSYATIAEKRGVAPTVKANKGIYYLDGLTEGTETILFLCACCIWPNSFVVLATLFGILCLVTTCLRIYRGYCDFKG